MSIIRATVPKKILAASLAAFMATPLYAQDMTALDKLISGSASEEIDTQSDTIRDVILLKIMELAKQSSMPPIAQQDGTITIREIDMLNRTAERAKTDLELQKTSVESKKTQLEGLISIY